jgi:ABC-type polysaccharide/polyol phosphate transport system ATPase subunit
MVSIRVKNLSLVYHLPRKFGLASQDRRVTGAGGQFGVKKNQIRSLTALNDISFELKPGDRLGLIGPNGAGKTTLLKVLYGIYEPTSGTLEIEGRVDALFNVSLGFRREATGRRNIELRGLINGWRKEEIAERLEEIIAFSELGDFIDMPFKTYSQGMAARLAFSIATSFKPEVLLMDEWIGAGDAQFQEKARKRMVELTKSAGIVVLASHNQTMLEKTCNKILELRNGRISKYYKL